MNGGDTGSGEAASPVLCAYRTVVEHTVTFIYDFANPGEVVRTTDGQWARLTGVTIHLHDTREPRVWAGGQRCRKDGERDRRMGHVGADVQLPDPDVWIERARQAIEPDDYIAPWQPKVVRRGRIVWDDPTQDNTAVSP